jgi:hypothetical protein
VGVDVSVGVGVGVGVSVGVGVGVSVGVDVGVDVSVGVGVAGNRTVKDTGTVCVIGTNIESLTMLPTPIIVIS